jgi:hypothetical protein
MVESLHHFVFKAAEFDCDSVHPVTADPDLPTLPSSPVRHQYPTMCVQNILLGHKTSGGEQ